MDAEVKRAWVAALRSGQYKQGQGALCKINGKERRFCCLGVLCDLGKSKSWVPSPLAEDGQMLAFHQDGRGWVASLPSRIAKQINLNGDEHAILVQMNDSGKSFKEIADWIEENL